MTRCYGRRRRSKYSLINSASGVAHIFFAEFCLYYLYKTAKQKLAACAAPRRVTRLAPLREVTVNLGCVDGGGEKGRCHATIDKRSNAMLIMIYNLSSYIGGLLFFFLSVEVQPSETTLHARQNGDSP